ncbi:hypothetical protein M0805_003938 [Coniferiporia weirii]|nr:hypothetical protein M0805_003938 [Coniferiporia weirii]
MPVTASAKNGKQQHGGLTPANVPAAALVDTPTHGGKKKRKKKTKGRTGGAMPESTNMHDVMSDADDDLPTLEPCRNTTAFPHTRTGLSPDLESVHLSTTASLASLSAAVRQSNGHSNGQNLGALDAAPAELLAELYRKVGFGAAGAVADEVREVRESLDALPSGMRAFVQSALAGMNGLDLGSDEAKQRTLYAIAQQLLEGSVGVGVGVGVGPGGRTNNNGTGRTTCEPGALSELTITQTLERPVAGKAALPARGGMGGQTALHASVVLSPEFIDSDGVYGDEIYSEDEVDEEELEMHMDMRRMRAVKLPFETEMGTGQFSVSYEEDLLELPGAYPASFGNSNGTSPRKKNKKKKKKYVSSTPYAEPEPELGPEPEGPGADVTGKTVTPSTNTHPIQQPIRSPSAMPPARAAANPPPSSRAAGKQPMSYAPAAPAVTSPPASTNPPRSARAAAKAPAPPQNYTNHNHPHHHPSPPSSNASAPQKHRPPAGATQNSANVATKPNSKIWSTNTTEERERIKEFWLGLGEDDRRALVKIEKEAVLKKMKEQQKHSCTCAVCGRKRNAIEEELEVLYDAYYEELEQYANYQQRYASSGGTLPPPPGPGPFPGSVELDKNGLVVGPGGKAHPHPPSARAKTANTLANGPKKGTVPDSEYDEDDQDPDDYEEDYDEEDEDEEEDEEDDVDAEDDVDIRNRGGRRGAAPNRDRARSVPNGAKANGRDELFNFGNSLTVAGPGNILTVADDLLKNDGQKFLEMMEQLAERRMQREEEAAADVEDESEEEEEEEDGDEEDDGEDDEDDEDDEDEEEALTEEQKMEEGKRMFSIFAARMFEQRVLGAYREKVAQERQMELLREEEAEEAAKKEKEAKKAKENQKKKDKKRQQKLAKEEEKAVKAAERAAEEAAHKEKQRQQEEEQKKKREEERLKREAVRKAADEERQKKEEERRKRAAEEKELQAERERKRREKEERAKAERREREEKERKVREEREARLAAEKAKQQQEKEEREKRQKEREEKAEREAKERQAQQQRAAAAKARPPSSPRANAVASSSQRQQPPATTPKKILNKPSAQPAAAPSAQPVRQPPRPVVTMQSTTPVPPQHAQSSQHSSPIAPANLPPSTPIFPQSAPVPAPVLSPRAPFATAPGVPSFGAYIPQMTPPTLGPSALPRTFGAGPPFEPGFGRGLAPAAPIGPPKVGLSNPLTSPIMVPGPSGPTRRMSTAADLGPGPGPITRPIAPIARPMTTVNGDAASGSGSGSGGASPSRRSPSPKGVLGSSALAADDDEVVSGAGRRVAPVGQGWHSPRASVAAQTPWGNAPPTPGFPSSPRTLGGGSVGLNMGLWGQGAPPGPGMPNPNPNAGLNEWHPHPASHFFAAAPFIHHSRSVATPPPHSSGN